MASNKKKAEQLGLSMSADKVEEIKFVPPSADELDSENEQQMDDFNILMDNLSTTEEKVKSLWKQIYQNALIDRRNSYILFGDLYNIVAGNANEHGIHGNSLAKYLERMSKANDQLIKLAELVDAATHENEETIFSDSNLYSQISKTS